MSTSTFLWGVFMVAAIASLRLIFSAIAATRRRQKGSVSESMVRENIISSIRLRQPPGAQLAVLEHKLRFKDERNRNLVAERLAENGFEITTAETYEEEAAFWLLAKRSVLVDHAPDEMKLVATFTNKSGGTYADCTQSI